MTEHDMRARAEALAREWEDEHILRAERERGEAPIPWEEVKASLDAAPEPAVGSRWAHRHDPDGVEEVTSVAPNPHTRWMVTTKAPTATVSRGLDHFLRDMVPALTLSWCGAVGRRHTVSGKRCVSCGCDMTMRRNGTDEEIATALRQQAEEEAEMRRLAAEDDGEVTESAEDRYQRWLDAVLAGMGEWGPPERSEEDVHEAGSRWAADEPPPWGAHQPLRTSLLDGVRDLYRPRVEVGVEVQGLGVDAEDVL